MEVLAAGFWGFVGGVPLLVGALLGPYAGASRRVISVVMGAVVYFAADRTVSRRAKHRKRS